MRELDSRKRRADLCHEVREVAAPSGVGHRSAGIRIDRRDRISVAIGDPGYVQIDVVDEDPFVGRRLSKKCLSLADPPGSKPTGVRDVGGILRTDASPTAPVD